MRKKIAAIIFTIIMTLCNVVPATAATSTYDTAKAAYIKYMQRMDKIYNGKYADVDQNGVPELLVNCVYKGQSYHMLCTYNKATKKVVFLKRVRMGKEFYYGLQYNTAKHRVYFNQSSTGGSRETLIKVSGTKISTVATYQSSRHYPEFLYTYKVNGKSVSYNTWCAKRTAAFKNYKYVF